MQSRTVELWVGLFVALGLAALAFLSVRASNLAEYRDGDAYTVVARFDNIGSLRVRAPVTVAGVRVGRVAAIDFDNEQFKAVVKLAITARYDNLPQDTVAGDPHRRPDWRAVHRPRSGRRAGPAQGR